MQSSTLVQPLSLIPNPQDSVPLTSTEPLEPIDDRSTVGLVELILKSSDHVDRLTRDGARQAELIPRFLAISLVGFTIFGVAATLMLNVAVAMGSAGAWPRGIPAAHWHDWSLANLVVAYDIGLVAATGVCLPSFYFFGLLAGVKPTMLGVLTHAMKGKSVAAVTLVGILPVYVVVVLGMIVFRVPTEWTVPLHGVLSMFFGRSIAANTSVGWTELTLYGALALPFAAGLNGVRSLYVGFLKLTDTLPPNQRCRRECLLRRLVFAWSACYTAVTPLMVYTIWNHLAS